MPQFFSPRTTPLALAAALACSALTYPAEPAHAQSQPTVRHYDIAAGSLNDALNTFAAQAGVAIAIDDKKIVGLKSPSLRGDYGVEQGFERLLAGSGYRAGKTPVGYVLVPVQEPPATRNDSQTLVPVLVKGVRDDNLTENSGSYAAATSSLGGKTMQSLREIPQTVSVLTREKIDDNNLQNIYDVMNSAPGVTMYQGSMTTSRFMSRGFEIGNYRIDGGAASYVDGYMADWDMAFYDHVEVLRGADGLFGAAAEPGGTINFVRKKPTRELQIKTSLQAGSWNYKRAELDVGGPLNDAGTLRGRGVAAYEDKGFFYDTAGSHSKMAYGVLEADLSKSTMLTFGATYIDRVSSHQGYGLPSSSTGEDLHLPRSTFLSGIDDRLWAESINVFSSLRHDINDDWTAKLSVEYGVKRQKRTNYYFSGAIDAATGEGLTGQDGLQLEKWRNKSIDLALTGKFSAWGKQHDVVIGAAWQNFLQSSNTLSGGEAAVPSIYTFNPADYRRGTNLTPTTAYDYPVDQFGVYGSLRLQLSEPLHLILGGRVSSYDYKYKGYTLNAAGAVTKTSVTQYKDSRVFTPYVGVTYDLSKEWTAYASMAQTFKSQANYLSAPNTPLDPVTGRNVELGVKGEHFGGRMQTAVALYEIHREGAAVANGTITTYPDGSRCCYTGTGKIISQGLDAEISGEPLTGLQLSASYNYNYNRNRRSTESRYETLTPKSLFKTSAAYQLPGALSRMKVGGGMHVQTKTYQKEDGVQVSQGGYSIWNLFGDYKLSDKWSLAVNVNNLFDKRYYSTIGYYYYGNFYGAPRNVMLTLRGSL